VRVMVDNDPPPNLARALHLIVEADGDQVIALRDKFGRQNVKDEEWIETLGTEGNWAVLSADMRIAKQRPSRDAFVSAGLVGLFFPPSLQKATLAKQAARLLSIWPDIREQVRLNAHGCFEMPAKGSKFRQIGR
jgi:hypothetical protein